MLLLLTLNACASAAGPASRPLAATPPLAAGHELTPITLAPCTTCAAPRKLALLPPLDDTGQRELMAGFELELGDERAKTKAAETQTHQLEGALAAEKARSMWVPALIGGTVGVVIGFALGVLVVRR